MCSPWLWVAFSPIYLLHFDFVLVFVLSAKPLLHSFVLLPTDALGYEEIIVDVYPYGSTIAVKAIALRVAKHSKLQHDIAPSARYMDIIIKGAEELKLEPLYIQNLKSLPKVKLSKTLETLARKSVFFTGFLFRKKLNSTVDAISSMTWFFYYGEPVSAAFFNSSM